MRAVKFVICFVALVGLTRYLPVYYRSREFNNYVLEETKKTRFKDQLKESLLSKARIYSIPITESDIKITSMGAVYRVSVNYSVPVDLFVYSPELKFRVVGAGLTREQY